MIKADIVCDICGKKRGRPNNHDLCAIKRKAKHAAIKPKPRNSHTTNYTDRNIDGLVKTLEGTYHD